MPQTVIGAANRPSSIAQRVAYAFAQPLYTSDAGTKELNIVQKATERVGDVLSIGAGLGIVIRLINKLVKGNFAHSSGFEALKNWAPDALLLIGAAISKVLTINGKKLHVRKAQRDDYARNVIPEIIHIIGDKISNLQEPEDELSVYNQGTANGEDGSIFKFLKSIDLSDDSVAATLTLNSFFGLELIKENGDEYLQTMDDSFYEHIDGYEYGLKIDVNEGFRVDDLLGNNQILLIARPKGAKSSNDIIEIQPIDNTLGELIYNWLPPELKECVVGHYKDDLSASIENKQAVDRLAVIARSAYVNSGGQVLALYNG